MKKSNTPKIVKQNPKKVAKKKEVKSVLQPTSKDISNPLQKKSENGSSDKTLIKISKLNKSKETNLDRDLLEEDFELPTDISDFEDEGFNNENDYYETPIDDF
ncbi:hypothetical protein [Flavobacterium luteum]|uniref:Uncharacterized protein n=1 Tax=Flavobacterium luteum TaxID=2026654 RepID=A0A7J5AJX7_9FLAO|nr:hypothetical protein [Flavobacterium luteum]KAB1157718.1 hypothetical protein F6464_01135 [Flavobacterium luteum]